jgi:hypothetical protein
MSVPLSEPRRPIFDRVAEQLKARWFAVDAMIEPLAFLVSPAQEFSGAIDG